MTSFAPQSRAESLSVTSSPPGANVEINGVLVETSPFHAEFPVVTSMKPLWFSVRGSTIQ
jgi:hypothetical protein